MQPDSPTSAPTTKAVDFHVEFPADGEHLEQDHEWCYLRRDGHTERLRFHDYNRVFEVPGLYEHLFYERLDCASPQMVRSLLEGELRKADIDQADLSVIDVGAGNGMVGEEFRDLGSSTVVGIDLIPEAAEAADRDRPEVYDEYFVADLTELTDRQVAALRDYEFNCLVSVAALGFGDIPPQAFAEAYNLVSDGGWIALNIKEDFLDGEDSSGFSRLIESLIETGRLEIRAQERYRHRYAADGEELMYIALVGVKHDEATDRLVERAEQLTD
ncbi:MAG TPA: methyltransferase domain-containing protein [Solirubrobacteraceae bacterium]|jgi:predicted TPR repeat methyltransferase